MVAQTPINDIIFRKTIIRTFRFVYINCFNRLKSAQNCRECTFLDNLWTTTQKGSMEVRQMTPFFLSTFSTLSFQNQCTTFCCRLFHENYLNPQVKINKGYTLSYFYISHIFIFLEVYLSRIFLEFFPKLAYSTMVVEKFQSYSVKIIAMHL